MVMSDYWMFEERDKEIQSLRAENERLKEIYIKLTNSEYVLNELEEPVGYVATHEIMNEFDGIFKTHDLNNTEK